MGDFKGIRGSHRLKVELPEWLARKHDLPTIINGYVSWQSDKAVFFISRDLEFENWLPKSQLEILEVH